VSVLRGGVLLVVLGVLLVAVAFVVGPANDASGGDAVYVLRGYGAESQSGASTGELVGVPAFDDGNLWLGPARRAC
jgi:hypothetical protein